MQLITPLLAAQQLQIDRADLAAQEAMALWAERMTYAAAAQALLSLIGLLLLALTLWYTRKAAASSGQMVKEAQLTTKAAVAGSAAAEESAVLSARSQRPWIKLVVAAQKVEVLRNRASLTLLLEFENLGDTPAFDVQPQTVAWTPTVSVDGHQLRRQELIEGLERLDATSSGFALLPNEKVSQSYLIPIEGLLDRPATSANATWVFAGVRYSFSGGTGKTVRAQWLWQKSSQGALIPIDRSEGVINAADLVLHRQGVHEIAT